MADSLKATLQIDADTTGLARGVAGAVAQLKALNQTASATSTGVAITAGIGIVRAAVDLVRQAVDMINSRQADLQAKALAWSPEAISAQARADTVQMAADRAIGVAMGPGAASVEASRAAALVQEAARVQKMSPALNGAMAGWGSMKADFGNFWNAAMDNIGLMLSGQPGSALQNQSIWAQQSGTLDFYQGVLPNNQNSLEGRGEGLDVLKKILAALGG